jgi:hypothetical protein
VDDAGGSTSCIPGTEEVAENGYSLKVLVRVLKEKGFVITTSALSTYMTKLAPTREEAQPRTARKGTSVPSPTIEIRRGQFQMKPYLTL